MSIKWSVVYRDSQLEKVFQVSN